MNEEKKLLEKIFEAYYCARKNKRNTKAQLHFEINVEENIMKIYEEIKNRTYKPKESICFIINYPVKREVFASQFSDRVVHHLLYNYIMPIFEKIFIYDSYSCRKKKGTHFGIKRLEHHIRSETLNYTQNAFILKLDILGYFMSINKLKLHEIVCGKLEKYWNENEENIYVKELIIYLINVIIFNEPSKHCEKRSPSNQWMGLPRNKSLFHAKEHVGLPIGDITSQLFSNVYLHELDHYIKHNLKFKHYGRYVDDFFIVHQDKEILKKAINNIDDFLKEKLNLKLHPRKIYLQPYQKGVCFLGGFVKPHRIYLSKKVKNRCRNKFTIINKKCEKSNIEMEELKDIRAEINSYCGHLMGLKSYKIRKDIFDSNKNIFKYFYSNQNLNKIMLRKEYKAKYSK